MPISTDWESVVGQTYSELTVLSLEGRDHASKMLVRCQCSCGKVHTLRFNSIQSGQALSCGHANREATAARNTIHGLSYHPDFQVWVDMNKRCHGSDPGLIKNYKDRGISVCEQWRKDPAQFFKDMGPRTKGMTLERVDNSKGYSPENCVWASMKTQQNNKRTNVVLELHGRRMTISQWANELGMSKNTIWFRVKRGLSHKEVLTNPIDTRYSRPRKTLKPSTKSSK